MAFVIQKNRQKSNNQGRRQNANWGGGGGGVYSYIRVLPD